MKLSNKFCVLASLAIVINSHINPLTAIAAGYVTGVVIGSLPFIIPILVVWQGVDYYLRGKK